MNVAGRIQNGVVVFDGPSPFPDGTAVVVTVLQSGVIVQKPGQLPFVSGGVPGSVHLTNEIIAKILEEEDLLMIARCNTPQSDGPEESSGLS